MKQATDTRTLPNDPDGMNQGRSDSADGVILSFEYDTGTDREDVIADLMTNMMHWCDRNEFDFGNELDRALRSYTSETDPY